MGFFEPLYDGVEKTFTMNNRYYYNFVLDDAINEAITVNETLANCRVAHFRRADMRELAKAFCGGQHFFDDC